MNKVASILTMAVLVFTPAFSFADENNMDVSDEVVTEIVSEEISEEIVQNTDTTDITEDENETDAPEEEVAEETDSNNSSVFAFNASNSDSDVTPTDISHSCVSVDSMGDITVEPIVHGNDSVSLQDVFNTESISKNVVSDQKQYQVLHFNNVSTTFTFEFISRVAALSSTFGYYTAGNTGSFVPVFNSGITSSYPTTPTFTEGQSTSTTIYGAGNFGFAIKVDTNLDTWTTENGLNTLGADQAVFYELANNAFLVAFEDLPLASSDKDYNDMVVRVTVVDCNPVLPPSNTPPTITLIGNNPLNLFVGDTFVDPGATAFDTEDGNLTAQIVTTGTVNTALLGTSTITYSIHDSGGFGATTTREVVISATTTPPTEPPVEPPTNPPANPPSGGGGGTGGRRHDVSNLLTTGEILGATTCFYLRDFLHKNWNNDPIEVLKLQSFLNVFEGEQLSYTSVFDEPTLQAVERFQNKYFTDILEPWGHDAPTGFVYILTKKKVNEIYCNALFPVSLLEQSEINSFRAYIEDLKARGIPVNESPFVPADTVGSIPGDADISDGQDVDKTDSPVVELDSETQDQSILRNAAVTLFALPTSTLVLSGLTALAALFVLLAGSSKKELTPVSVKEEPYQVDDTLLGIKDKDESPIIILPGKEEKGVIEVPEEEIVIDEEEQEA